MNGPLVSIVVNNFNYEAFLRQSVESALSQTHPHTEVIVVDDASTDGSRDIIRSFGSRIVPVLQERNGGQAAALNAGFATSRGEIVIFLDADDYLYPQAATRVVSRWTPSVCTVQYRLHLVDRDGTTVDVYPDPNNEFDSGNVIPKLLAFGRYRGNVTSGNAFARRTLETILPIPEERFRICADSYLITVAPFYGTIASIEEPLGAYRQHGANRWLSAPSVAQAYRREILHDLDKYELLRERAAAFGLAVDREVGLREPSHLLARLGSLCLEPDQHPVPSDKRFRLGLRNAWAARLARLGWRRRAVAAAWFLGVGLLPSAPARRLFAWRYEASSRPRLLARALSSLRPPAR